MNNIKCLVFDCDGVILDSVNVKTNAFAKLAEPYGEAARAKMVDYHTLHGGVSRFLKFEWFFREILNQEITPDESEAWNKKFREYALEEVMRCNLINGALATLERWHGKLPMYICTGAPEAEVREILSLRKLSCFFDGIYGSPPTKDLLLEKIVKDIAHVPSLNALMVGDARTDMEAAKKSGTLFYGIGEDLKPLLKDSGLWSKDLVPLNAWIAQNIKN